MIVNYALHLKAAGHDAQVVITVPFARDVPYIGRLRAAGIPIKCLGRQPHYLAQLALRKGSQVLPFIPFLQKFRDWEEDVFRTAVAFLRRERPDIVHVIAEGGLYIRAAHAAGIPVIHQEPAIPFYGDAPEVQVSYSRLTACLPLASELMAVSPRIAQLCRERLNCPEHVSVMPILVDDPTVGDGSDRSLDPDANQSQSTVTFGFAARIEALKGPMVLLEAFARILPQFPQARLIIAGSGEQDDAIRQRAVELGVTDRCAFPGPYYDEAGKRAFRDKIDVLVHPSLFEGTPCTMIEAMAFGLPVIASAVGGVPDMVTPETGLLVPPSDVEALAAAMSQLVADEPRRRRLGEGGRTRFHQVFAPTAVLPLLLQKYRQVIERANGGKTVAVDCPHPWADLTA
jgi:glycosyltransferase involved in cell wall biosynthesis